MLKYTKRQLQSKQKRELGYLLSQAGTAAHLARMLNVSSMCVQGWINRGRISKAGAKLVESHVELGKYHKAKDLRPDL